MNIYAERVLELVQAGRLIIFVESRYHAHFRLDGHAIPMKRIDGSPVVADWHYKQWDFDIYMLAHYCLGQAGILNDGRMTPLQ